MTDVLVIGGGIAGFAAALAASQAGATTVLIRPAPGATALAGGGWYAAPPDPVRAALATAGLGLIDARRLPHPDGRIIDVVCAPPSHADAELSDAAHILVCGIAGLPAFRPVALAALWADAAALPPGALIPLTLDLDDTPAGGWSALSLAALIEREPQRIATPLGAAARRHGAARAIVPPVLGLTDHARVHHAVGRSAGITVGEALGVAPSLPGWRLDRAMLTALEQAGVRVITGRARAHPSGDGVIRTFVIETRGESVTLTAVAAVLATGKFLGGGIAADERFTETALDCDVALERFGRTFDDAGESLVLTDPVRTEPQPILSLGVQTNADSAPVTDSGDVIFANVVVAGSVRAGVETSALGLGAAAHDGWLAGTRAAALAHRSAA